MNQISEVRALSRIPLSAHLAWTGLACLLILAALLAWLGGSALQAAGQSGPTQASTIYLPFIGQPATSFHPSATGYVVIGWNDLGMHCYDREYSAAAVLPPYNTLWAQVIKLGDPPQIVTQGIKVIYAFQDNTESASKTNFWTYAQQLFGLSSPLPLNIGLKGKGLSGEMDAASDHFTAVGIPLTEYRDSDPTTPYYFQLANLAVFDTTTGDKLTETTVVAPISSEMMCVTCHSGPTSNVRVNILMQHDDDVGTNLVNQQPVLCASCHADPALGATGQPDVPTLSSAMHSKHAEEGLIQTNCYACHPGPNTQCLRDVMSQKFNKTCTDCHGLMYTLGNPARTPWVTLPQCGNCHGSAHAENPGTLYRNSTGHGGLYCEACHNSTHAILASRENNDNLQSIALQGYAGTIQECQVCHLTQPTSGGPHQ